MSRFQDSRTPLTPTLRLTLATSASPTNYAHTPFRHTASLGMI